MKSKEHVRLVCKGFCKFYKEGRSESTRSEEEMACAGLLFFESLPSSRIESLIHNLSPEHVVHNNPLSGRLCESCEFSVDGCDFRAGSSSPPCGGYVLLSMMLEKGFIDEEEVRGILKNSVK
ncbi:MAG: hypothetical protein HZC12_02055 [Nitrospirae bacterium]|nr:hypothetical protein [Nitrospirota bacterium]